MNGDDRINSALTNQINVLKGEDMKRHSTMVGKSKIKNLIVTDATMVTLSLDKGEDLTELIQNLEAARRDNRTTKTVRLWVKDSKIYVSNRYKAKYCKDDI